MKFILKILLIMSIVSLFLFYLVNRNLNNVSHKPTESLIVISIPESLDIPSRIKKYEKPIDNFLNENNLGYITGGGTFMDKEGDINYIDIDVGLYEIEPSDETIEIIIQNLRDMRAPSKTSIYNVFNEESIEVL